MNASLTSGARLDEEVCKEQAIVFEYLSPVFEFCVVFGAVLAEKVGAAESRGAAGGFVAGDGDGDGNGEVGVNEERCGWDMV